MNRDLFRQTIVALSVLAVIVVNGLANALPINDRTTGEISDRFDVLFVPAGYVFSIWGLIYVGLIVYAVYQFLPSQRDNPRLRAIAPWFVLSCAANIAWIFLWHYEMFVLTLPAMLTLLGSLIAIYLALGIGRGTVPPGERIAVRAPFSIYLGWVTVATIANVTAVLDFVQWDAWGLSAETWTVIMLVAGTAIALAVAFTRGDFVYPWVVVWAFAGIAVRQQEYPAVVGAAWALAVAVALGAVITALRHRPPEQRVI